ncbi:MAG: hypothetical protein OEV89_08945 [Desulfobulbaceae bacterium]|nr:hypothetical protein [Desulfobulbaceae bacterium]HIJ90817.1 hypothetical protein [Deltaproteobacteria bacterium]
MRLINRKKTTPLKRVRTPNTVPAMRFSEVPAAPRLPTTSAILGNERGMALVMALILGLVGMLIIASLLFMVGTGIGTSGSKKRYQMALEASHGGMIFFAQEIIQRGLGGDTLSAMGTYDGMLTQIITDANFTTKLTTTGNINDGVYPAAPVDATLTLTFTAPAPNINVNTAILSTNRGNSGTSSNVLVGGGVVISTSGTVTPQHIPYLFQTDIQGQNAVNSRQRARLSGIYAY